MAGRRIQGGSWITPQFSRSHGLPFERDDAWIVDRYNDLLVAQVVTKHEEEAAATPAEGAAVAVEPEVAKKGKAPAEGDAAAAKTAPGKAAAA